jgi:uncharacterized RDD family membrane protein YckC
MDPQEYAEAVERLERDYLAGGMSADEYTRRRRELEDAASTAEGPSEPAPAWAPMPPDPTQGAIPASGDPVTGVPLASWGRRAAGWFVDLGVYVVAFVATFFVALATEDSTTGETSDAAALLVFLVWFLGPTLYTWLMVGAWGQTLGKMAVGIRVVRSADASRVSYPRALGRAASTWVLGVFFIPILLAYLWPLWDRRNQTLYDKMAGTIVAHGRGGAHSTA